MSTEAVNQSASLEEARTNLGQIATELNHSFYERQTEVRGLLVGLIARENVLLLGPPGTAKTELARDRVATRVVEKCMLSSLAMQLLAVRQETFQRDMLKYIP